MYTCHKANSKVACLPAPRARKGLFGLLDKDTPEHSLHLGAGDSLRYAEIHDRT